MFRGVVKSYNPSRGFGFIVTPDGNEVFRSFIGTVAAVFMKS